MSGPPPDDQASDGRTLLLLIAAAFVVSLDSRVITPVLPAIADDFDASVGDVGLVVTAYLLPYGLFQLLYGPLGDRIGRVRVVAIALGGFALGATLSALAPGLDALVLCRLWTGLSAAAVFPMTLTYVGDTIPYTERSGAIGRLVMATSLAQVLSSAVGGLLAAVVSWRAIFLLDGLAALVITAAIVRRRSAHTRPPGARRTALAPYGVVLRDRRHILFYLLIFVEGGFTIGAFSYFGALLRDRDGFSYAAIGLIVALFGVTSVMAGRSLRGLARRLGERGMIAVGGAGTAGGFALTAVEPAIPFFLVAMLLSGLTYILLHSTLQARASELAPTARATGVALFALALFLGSGAGAYLVARAIDALGYNETMLLLAAVTAAFTAVGSVAILPWSQARQADIAEREDARARP